MRGAGRSAARQAGTPPSVPHSSNGMKKTKFLYPPPFRRFHNPRHRSHGNLVRTGYQGGRRCRAGRVAETRLEIFIRGPGPLRGSPAPAKATAGAPTIGQDHRRGAGKAPYIYFTRCRPSAPLPDCSRQGEFFDNGQTRKRAWQQRSLCLPSLRDRPEVLAIRDSPVLPRKRGDCRRHCRAPLLPSRARPDERP